MGSSISDPGEAYFTESIVVGVDRVGRSVFEQVESHGRSAGEGVVRGAAREVETRTRPTEHVGLEELREGP